MIRVSKPISVVLFWTLLFCMHHKSYIYIHAQESIDAYDGNDRSSIDLLNVPSTHFNSDSDPSDELLVTKSIPEHLDTVNSLFASHKAKKQQRYNRLKAELDEIYADMNQTENVMVQVKESIEAKYSLVEKKERENIMNQVELDRRADMLDERKSVRDDLYRKLYNSSMNIWLEKTFNRHLDPSTLAIMRKSKSLAEAGLFHSLAMEQELYNLLLSHIASNTKKSGQNLFIHSIIILLYVVVGIVMPLLFVLGTLLFVHTQIQRSKLLYRQLNPKEQFIKEYSVKSYIKLLFTGLLATQCFVCFVSDISKHLVDQSRGWTRIYTWYLLLLAPFYVSYLLYLVYCVKWEAEFTSTIQFIFAAAIGLHFYHYVWIQVMIDSEQFLQIGRMAYLVYTLLFLGILIDQIRIMSLKGFISFHLPGATSLSLNLKLLQTRLIDWLPSKAMGTIASSEDPENAAQASKDNRDQARLRDERESEIVAGDADKKITKIRVRPVKQNELQDEGDQPLAKERRKKKSPASGKQA